MVINWSFLLRKAKGSYIAVLPDRWIPRLNTIQLLLTLIKDTNADTPARYNADKRRLYDASGCSGKLAVFAVRLDTFEKENEEKTIYYSTNNAEDLTRLRKKIINEIEELPIYAEYMHNEAYSVSKKYGKDAFYLIYYFI